MSLLDDVSIVVTPNGYKAGELYAVVPVPTEGAELVTNGDFSADASWSKGAGWTISSGKASSDGSQSGNSELKQQNGVAGVSLDLQVGKQYKMVIDITVSTGAITYIEVAGNTNSNDINATGVSTLYFSPTSTNDRITIAANSTFVGSINSVSVKEYTAADMDVTRATAATRVDEAGLVNYAEIIGSEEVTDGNFPSGTTAWTFVGGSELTTEGARINNTVTGTNSYAQQILSGSLSGKQFVLTYDVILTNGTTLALEQASSLALNTSTTGTNRKLYFTWTRGNNSFVIKRLTTGTDVTIDNVSLKELIRDNVPRIDYSGGGCPHILAEPQRTNVFIQNDISTWNGFSSYAGNTTAPDGTTINFVNMEDRRIFPTTTISNSTEYTSSIYLKGNKIADVKLRNTAGLDTVITLSTEWKRFELTATSVSTVTNSLLIDARFSQGMGASGLEIAIYGGQVEEGSFPTSYIPTSGSTVTRNKDQFTRDGIVSLINSTEGVLFVEFKTLTETGVFRQFNLSKDNSNRIYITKRGDSGNLEFRMENPSGNLNFSFSENTTNDFVKVAFRYGLNNFAVFIDGVNKNVTATGNVFASGTLNTLEFDSPLGQPFFGKVKQLQVYKTALTDAQLISLTS